MAESAMKRVGEFLLSPWMVFGGMVAGGLIGWYLPEVATQISPLGELYLRILQMSVIPILLTAVIGGLTRLFISGAATHYISHLLSTIVFGLLVASLIGILVGQIGMPGSNLQQSAQATLGTTISTTEFNAAQDIQMHGEVGIVSFFVTMIPDNIFAALTQDNRLSIVFFSIIVGVALGSLGAQMAGPALASLDAFYETFIAITRWLMYALPFGLLCLTAGHIAGLGFEIIGAMFKLLMLMGVGALLLIVIQTVVIWLKVGGNIFDSFSALRETLIVALGTASSFTAIPSALRGLKESLKIDKDTVDLVLPLGITINPPGSVFHFSLSALFIAQLYATQLSMDQYILIFLGAAMAGIAASGAPGVAALSMIAIVLQPLGLPASVAIILLAAIDPIVDPILTVVNVHANCATTVLVASNKNSQTLVQEEQPTLIRQIEEHS
jgi:proton glutamate symport protein